MSDVWASELNRAKRDNHRERLLERFATHDPSFDDLSAIEFLLTFAIPGVDVRPAAALLLGKYGNLDEVLSADPEELRQKLESRSALLGELKPLWMRATGLLPAEVSHSLVLENLLTANFWRDADSNRWREPTAEERERMNDDRSLRVLHDAARFVNNTLDLPTMDEERCQWIDVLFQACRAIEDKEADALPALRGFDKAEAYALVPRLFQSILRDHVSKEVYTRAEKQARAASQRVQKQPKQQSVAKGKRDAGDGQTVLEFD